jgi:hypothetical protein
MYFKGEKMTYTYNIENKNEKYSVEIKYSHPNGEAKHGRLFNTEAEAESWATNSIQAMQDNNNVFVNVEG